MKLWCVYDREYLDEGSLFISAPDEEAARRLGADALGMALEDLGHLRVLPFKPEVLVAQVRDLANRLIAQRESLDQEAALLRMAVTKLKEAWGERGAEHQVLIDNGDDQWPLRSLGLETAILECVAALESTTIGQPAKSEENPFLAHRATYRDGFREKVRRAVMKGWPDGE